MRFYIVKVAHLSASLATLKWHKKTFSFFSLHSLHNKMRKRGINALKEFSVQPARQSVHKKKETLKKDLSKKGVCCCCTAVVSFWLPYRVHKKYVTREKVIVGQISTC